VQSSKSLESAKHEGKIIEQIYVSLIDSRMVLGVEILGLEEEWMMVWIVRETFCKRAVGVLGTAVSGELLGLKITDHRNLWVSGQGNDIRIERTSGK